VTFRGQVLLGPHAPVVCYARAPAATAAPLVGEGGYHVGGRRSRHVLFCRSMKCDGTNMQIRQELIVSSDTGGWLSDACTSRVASYDDRLAGLVKSSPACIAGAAEVHSNHVEDVQLMVTKSSRRELTPTSQTTTRPRRPRSKPPRRGPAWQGPTAVQPLPTAPMRDRCPCVGTGHGRIRSCAERIS
jgi:hypothetical protein